MSPEFPRTPPGLDGFGVCPRKPWDERSGMEKLLLGLAIVILACTQFSTPVKVIDSTVQIAGNWSPSSRYFTLEMNQRSIYSCEVTCPGETVVVGLINPGQEAYWDIWIIGCEMVNSREEDLQVPHVRVVGSSKFDLSVKSTDTQILIITHVGHSHSHPARISVLMTEKHRI